MKHCPTCQRTFDDEKVFCGSDGTRLVSDTPTAYADEPSAPPSSWPSTPAAPTNAWPASPATPTPAPSRDEPPRAVEQSQHTPAPSAHAGPLERIRCDWC